MYNSNRLLLNIRSLFPGQRYERRIVREYLESIPVVNRKNALKTSWYWILRLISGVLLLVSYSLAQVSEDAVSANELAYTIKADNNGKYWFIDPQGEPFLSIGVNNIISKPFRPRPNTQYYDPVPNQFDTYNDWKQEVFTILRQHGFNTIGSWSDGMLYDGPLYGTLCLYVAAHAEDRCLEGLRSGFADRVLANAKIILEQCPGTENVFGVFLDNEMPWFGHGIWGDIPNHTLLETALSLQEQDEARQAAINFLKERYDTPSALSKAWGKPLESWEDLTFKYARSCISDQANNDRKAFIALSAEAFYKTASETVRQMLPGKLILGTRYAAYAPEPVIRACGRYCDVISFNDYRAAPSADADLLAKYWIWGGKKPIMVTEFSWRAEENTSGNPNDGGAGAVVRTQAQRGENYQQYVKDLLSYPMVVGAHWFQFADQSPQGRFDGENSNYGIVDIHHRYYTDLLNPMKETNDRLVKFHSESDRQAPETLPAPTAVVFQPGQYPGRPHSVDLLESPVVNPELYHAPDAKVELQQKAGYLLVAIDTGEQWGCGVLFFGPRQFKCSEGPQYATNLDGYSAIEIDASIEKDIVFDLFLDEAGAAAPDAVSYDTSAGDDAESFLIPTNKGHGERFLYRFNLKDLQVRTEWGNQKGARRVDIHAMKGVSLFFPGAQGEDQIKIYSIKMAR